MRINWDQENNKLITNRKSCRVNRQVIIYVHDQTTIDRSHIHDTYLSISNWNNKPHWIRYGHSRKKKEGKVKAFVEAPDFPGEETWFLSSFQLGFAEWSSSRLTFPSVEYGYSIQRGSVEWEKKIRENIFF